MYHTGWWLTRYARIHLNDWEILHIYLLSFERIKKCEDFVLQVISDLLMDTFHLSFFYFLIPFPFFFFLYLLGSRWIVVWLTVVTDAHLKFPFPFFFLLMLVTYICWTQQTSWRNWVFSFSFSFFFSTDLSAHIYTFYLVTQIGFFSCMLLLKLSELNTCTCSGHWNAGTYIHHLYIGVASVVNKRIHFEYIFSTHELLTISNTFCSLKIEIHWISNSLLNLGGLPQFRTQIRLVDA